MRFVGSRLFKVIVFGTNRNGICYFLLVVNSNLGRILHGFGAKARETYPCPN